MTSFNWRRSFKHKSKTLTNSSSQDTSISDSAARRSTSSLSASRTTSTSPGELHRERPSSLYDKPIRSTSLKELLATDSNDISAMLETLNISNEKYSNSMIPVIFRIFTYLSNLNKSVLERVTISERRIAELERGCTNIAKRVKAKERYYEEQIFECRVLLEKHERYLESLCYEGSSESSEYTEDFSFNTLRDLENRTRTRSTYIDNSRNSVASRTYNTVSPTKNLTDTVRSREDKKKEEMKLNDKKEIMKEQRLMANHDTVDWCAFYGNRKGFTCKLKRAGYITGVKNYEEFLEQIEDIFSDDEIIHD